MKKKKLIKITGQKCIGCNQHLAYENYYYDKRENKHISRCKECTSNMRRKRLGQSVRATAKDSNDLIKQRILAKCKFNKNTGCLEWQGALSREKGYGNIRHKGKLQKTHRLIFCIANGIDIKEIKDVLICHSCDNPSCCNENHLFIGTHLDNMEDKVAKNRHFKKLDADKVALIRKEMKNLNIKKLRSLAIKYDVSERLIYAIKNGARHSKTGIIKPKFVCEEI